MEELEASLELNRILLENFEIDSKKLEKHLKVIRARKELMIEEKILKDIQIQEGVE